MIKKEKKKERKKERKKNGIQCNRKFRCSVSVPSVASAARWSSLNFSFFLNFIGLDFIFVKIKREPPKSGGHGPGGQSETADFLRGVSTANEIAGKQKQRHTHTHTKAAEKSIKTIIDTFTFDEYCWSWIHYGCCQVRRHQTGILFWTLSISNNNVALSFTVISSTWSPYFQITLKLKPLSST